MIVKVEFFFFFFFFGEALPRGDFEDLFLYMFLKGKKKGNLNHYRTAMVLDAIISLVNMLCSVTVDLHSKLFRD